MADIKITLSRNSQRYAADIDEEIQYLNSQGWLWYKLSGKGKPKKVEPGDYVYFVLKGKVAGRAIIQTITSPDGEILKTQKKKDISRTGWGIIIKKMEKPKEDILTNGFQSFRYLSLEEERTFPPVF